MNPNLFSFRALFSRWLPLVLLLAFAGAAAMAQTADPPGRVATLSHIEGSVVFAPPGETEWVNAVRNRPITGGDRLWTDEGARAELHLGSAALHMNGRTFVEVLALDADVLQLNLNEGSVNARVRELQGGENFEINTPQLAFRAMQPGDFRIDVDPARGTTRIVVRAGAGVAYGTGRGALQLQAGQQIAFAGRDLEQVAVPSPLEDNFDRWAGDRNRAEDQSMAARYVPREVVGYPQLDANGTWAQDATYGPVWFPRVTVADWAPYRYGRWEWIVPWGWTWIDDAPWGFAPFHYGRWAEIGSRWAWVPGRLGPRPAYAPALVGFVGGSNGSVSVRSGPGIGWYPLAPGEAWRPMFRASPRYVTNVNRYAAVNNNRYPGGYNYQRRPEAITSLRVEDFSRGRPQQHPPAQLQVQPRIQQFAPPVAAVRPPQPVFQPPGLERRQQAWQHQQQRAAAMQHRQPPQPVPQQQVAPAAVMQQPAPHPRGEDRGRGHWQQQRAERAAGQGQPGGEDEGGRGRGRGHRFN